MADKILKPRTKKQKLFFKYLTEGYNPTRAAVKSGYSPKCAGNQATVNTRKHRAYWSALMEKHGITEKKLLTKLDEGLEAKKVISANIVKVQSDDPTVVIQDAHAGTKDFIEVEDYIARHKYLDTAFRLKDAYPNTKIETENPLMIMVDM